MRRLVSVAGFLFLLPFALLAQETVPKAELYTGYSFLRMEKTNQQGWNASLDANFNKNLGMVIDASGHYNSQTTSLGSITNDVTGHIHSIMAGPRVSDPRGKWNPFAEALFGWARLNSKTSTSSGGSVFLSTTDSSNAFAMALGGGLDYQLLSYASLRFIQIDYQLFRSNGVKHEGMRVGAGLVFRFGRKS